MLLMACKLGSIEKLDDWNYMWLDQSPKASPNANMKFVTPLTLLPITVMSKRVPQCCWYHLDSYAIAITLVLGWPHRSCQGFLVEKLCSASWHFVKWLAGSHVSSWAAYPFHLTRYSSALPCFLCANIFSTSYSRYPSTNSPIGWNLSRRYLVLSSNFLSFETWNTSWSFQLTDNLNR